MIVGCASSQNVRVLVEEHQYGIFMVNIQTKQDLDSVKARLLILDKATSYCKGKKLVLEMGFNDEPSTLLLEAVPV